LTVNVLDNKSWSLGPLLNYRFGRDDDVDDDVVARMREVDASVELGGFVGWRWQDANDRRHQFTTSLQFQQDVASGHEGWLGILSARYFHPISRPLTLSLGVSTSYASDDYMDSYFSVDANNVARTGLPLFSAGGGMRDIRISPMAVFSFSPTWHVAGGIIISKLLGDASDSPVVDIRGDSTQLFAGVGVAYAW
jgi:outer membrane protein